jgi:hypothetical protein
MNEAELRELVRDVIGRHARGHLAGAAGAPAVEASRLQRHASHAMFVLPVGSDSDGPCLIEPAVACNHCGYCKSYGH